MRQMKFWITILFIAFFSCNNFAQSYKAYGRADILDSEKYARTKAIEKALINAVNFSGASLATIPSIMPYLDEEKSIYNFYGNEVSKIKIDEELKKDNKIYITATFEINKKANTCHLNQYKKPILIGNFKILEPSQASLGKIYNIGPSFAKILGKTIKQNSQSFTLAGITKNNISQDDPNLISFLAEEKNARFIIYGDITDLSATYTDEGPLAGKVARQFAIELYIADGKTGELIDTLGFRDIAQWPFANSSTLDTSSARFWTSSYGKMVKLVSKNIMLHMESLLSCKKALSQVISITNNTAQINAGKKQGIKIGQELKIWHQASYIDQYGNPRSKYNQTHIKVKVVQVYNNNATIKILHNKYINNLKIGDIISK